MKKTYRLKKEVSESLRKLFNGRAVEKAEEEWNNRPRMNTGLGFEKLCINLVRIQCEYGDWVTFTSDDFEEIAKYDPDGWNQNKCIKPEGVKFGTKFIAVLESHVTLVLVWLGDSWNIPEFNDKPFLYRKVDLSKTGWMFKK